MAAEAINTPHKNIFEDNDNVTSDILDIIYYQKMGLLQIWLKNKNTQQAFLGCFIDFLVVQ
jgi:hypothetical protein